MSETGCDASTRSTFLRDRCLPLLKLRRSQVMGRSVALLVWGGLCFVATIQSAAGQEVARHTLELGVVGQTSEDLIRPPNTTVYTVSQGSYQVGTPTEQAFGGVQLGYRYAFTRNFALEGRAGYLFGHQPTVHQSGGNELLVHAGIRASVPMGSRFSLFARVAPGFSSFDVADRFVLNPETPVGPHVQTGRITHFSVEKSVGVTYRLAHRMALSFAVSDMSLVEGDEYEATLAPIPCVPPYDSPCLPNGGAVVYYGNVEEHLVADISLERSFGRSFASEKPRIGGYAGDTPHVRNEALFLWVNQPQNYLSTGYLAASNGFGGEVAHSFLPWLDIDASVLTLPGGDDANYQDGGSKTEVFAGVKVGFRRRYYGVFGKVRPGMVTSPDTSNSLFLAPYIRNYNLALDTGAVVEVYPSGGHFVMRFDLGEVGTRYSAVKVAIPGGYGTQPLQYREAGLYTYGVGWRF